MSINAITSGSTLSITTAAAAAGGATPSVKTTAGDSVDVFGPAVKVDLSEEAKADASRLFRYFDEQGNEFFIEGQPMSEDMRQDIDNLLKALALSRLEERLLGPAREEKSRVNAERIRAIEASGADVLGEIIQDGKVIAKIRSIGGIEVESPSSDRNLARLGGDIAGFGVLTAGPLDLERLQKRLNLFGSGLSFIDRRTSQALEVFKAHQAGTLFAKATDFVPKLTQELTDQLMSTSPDLAELRKYVTQSDIDAINAKNGK